MTPPCPPADDAPDRAPAPAGAARLAPPPRPGADKGAWRAWARANRHALAREPQRARSVADGLLAWPGLPRGGSLLLYLAFGDEIDLAPLLALPDTLLVVSRTHADGRLTLHRFDPARLERHPLGFAQPPEAAPRVDPGAVDAALLPGLCFDLGGARLGYGRGYFDRLLPRLRADAPRVGVSFEALVVPHLPRESHDVPVTHLATERGVRALARQGG